MKTTKIMGVALAAALSMTAVNSATASECGLSCCIAAGVEGVGSSLGFSVIAQVDSMEMKTIKQGTTKLTTQQALDTGVSPMYAISTKMVMTKVSTNIAYRHDEDNAFILSIPYIINF